MRRETAEKPETKEGGDEKQSRRDRDLLDRYHAEQTSKGAIGNPEWWLRIVLPTPF